MPQGGERGSYAKSEQVRRRIVECCMEVFAETGFHAATMAGVARRAGVSHTGLLHHFPTKEDLLLAVIERRDHQIAEDLGADPGSTDADARLYLTSATCTNSPFTTPLGLLELDAVLSGEASVAEHPAHKALAERYAGIRSFYARMFRRLRDEDRLTADLTPEALAVILLAFTDGVRHQWLFDKEGVDISGSIDALLDLLVADVGDTVDTGIVAPAPVIPVPPAASDA
ncbi:TetR family transcriptional regulator (plasmid) [Rathayibacter sp. VKM Ac-2803]|uniref:TetR/AcrR family transcriptional regulator n=1 Tax=Rathayibacter caricis DSM 15933 TaxID=1328867 RepID=A0A2T4UNS1_9MICO|nr:MULTISPECIES: TetR/AcrR family transcriptional regulator [Rathayibacter]MWV51554.1 TetR family transcriptional regulator [Rathayibacter sp. VKM Ac-2803]PTL71157.1 TetR/AcrR family transcriptional regulator [Rathayibacter caricis DSM 15933]